VIAIPPLVRRFPLRRLPVTAAMIDVAFFGAVTAGPVVGGAAGLGIALVDPAPLGDLIRERATTPESYLGALAIAAGTALIASAGYVWAMRGIALELPR